MFIYCTCTQYLVGASFSLITASIRRGMEVISLWHCWCGMEAQVSLTVAFSLSAFFGLLFLIFLLTIPHIFSMGFRSGEFAGQSSTPTPWSFKQLLVILAVWAGAKSWWKMKSAIHRVVHLFCCHIYRMRSNLRSTATDRWTSEQHRMKYRIVQNYDIVQFEI